ncbi:HtaA domain-containing protein [Corynebacterium sp. 13CS0277]|uniref:HtaA domain-containing protein n=1 Tax=Corynebacterium sp. 13CS0277 TaxID=2071994 RepID=UPI001304C8E1|nr:HtaA domain-containing protein [Corynebacterium sp. 13CS0277]
MIRATSLQGRAAALAAAALAAAAAGLVGPAGWYPHAQAGTCGEFTWSIRDSLRSYLEGPIAHGGWESTGVTDTGQTFVFDVNQVDTVSSQEGTLRMPGEIRLFGHDGVLDTRLSDWQLHINGSTAEILVDFDAATVDPGSLQATGRTQGDDVPFVQVQLNEPANFDSGRVNLAGRTTITAEGAAMMSNFYSAGMEFADTSGSVSPSCAGGTSGDAGTRTTGGSTGGGTTGGSRAQELRIYDTDSAELRTMKELNNVLFVLGQNYQSGTESITNAEKLVDRIRGGSGTTPSGSNAGGNAGATGTAGGRTPSGVTIMNDASAAAAGDRTPAVPSLPQTTTGAPAAGAAGVAGQAPTGAASGEAPGAAECAAGDAKAVTATALRWGIKSSFLTYISGSIAKGAWALSNTTYDQGQFTFSGSRGSVNTAAKSGTIGYAGGVRFSGHGGKLDLMIANPEIVFQGSRGTLQATVVSSDMSGTRTDFGRVALADLTFSSLDVSDTQVTGTTSAVTLTAAGAQAFAGFYEAGTALAPLSFTASLGGAGDCATAAGTSASGAAVAGVATGTPEQIKAQAAQAAGASDVPAEEIAAPELQDEDKPSSFRMKSSAQAAPGTTQALDPVTAGLLVAAAFLVGGGAVSSFALRNPA